MDRAEIYDHICGLLRESPHNMIHEEDSFAPEDAEQKIFDASLMAVGSADDALWERMKEPALVGRAFRTPKEWLSRNEAKYPGGYQLCGKCMVKNPCTRKIPARAKK